MTRMVTDRTEHYSVLLDQYLYNVSIISHTAFLPSFPLFSYFDWRRAYKGNLLLQDLVTHEKKNLLRNHSKKSYECTSWSAVRHNPKSHEEFSESSAPGNVLNFIMLIASTMSIMSSTIHIYHIVTLLHLWKTFALIFKSWVQSNELWASLVQNHL